MEKEKSTNGEYEVEILKHFKLLPPDVKKTIFEEK
jgi:hypothetical protein